MNPGAILIGLAAAVLLGIYVAQPFRRRVKDLDALIEAWTARESKQAGAGARTAPSLPGKKPAVPPAEGDTTEEAPLEAGPSAPEVEPSEMEPAQQGTINFCHQCGKPVKPHHRFCPSCGARLAEE
jgi:hypothetical protein